LSRVVERAARGALLAAALSIAPAAAATGTPGNAVFLHPDGLAASHFSAARAYWVGPDGSLHWDRLPQIAIYRGHLSDTLAATSHGGATAHAFGYRVAGHASFGRDADASAPGGRPIRALSGFPGSLLREAAAADYPVGLVNDGHVGEPGTGAFAAEADDRDDWNGISLQLIAGGAAQPAPEVILGGGERNFLPRGSRTCTPAEAGSHLQHGIATYPLDCMVHTLDWSRPAGRDGRFGIGRIAGAERADRRNLLREAADLGYVVLRTRPEFDAARARLARDPNWRPRLLGLFAAHHTFNDRSEEELVAAGFRDAAIAPETRGSNLVLFGTPLAADPGFDPPRGHEMLRMALEVLQRHSHERDRPYFLVAEPESTDNFANAHNATGTLVAARIADQMIGVVHEAIEAGAGASRRTPFSTSLLVVADSDASGMHLMPLGRQRGAVPAVEANAAPGSRIANPADGMYGRATMAFSALPDQFGRVLHFGVVWAGGYDYAGGVVARAASNRAEPVRGSVPGCTLPELTERFHNTDVYRVLYAQLFGRCLPWPGSTAPSR